MHRFASAHRPGRTLAFSWKGTHWSHEPRSRKREFLAETVHLIGQTLTRSATKAGGFMEKPHVLSTTHWSHEPHGGASVLASRKVHAPSRLVGASPHHR